MDLLSAIQSESLTTIQDIVLKKDPPFDSTWLGYDALNSALSCKRKDVAKWLIQLLCRVNKDSNFFMNMPGYLLLHNAVKLGDIEIVQMLLENGASVVAIDYCSNSALHIAFQYHYDKITDLLLDYITTTSNFTNVKNNQGLSHLEIACARDNQKAIENFIQAGAKVL